MTKTPQNNSAHNHPALDHPALAPGQINQQPLANRFVLAPMSRASAPETGIPTSEMAQYYARFAQGGFGLLIAEGAYVDTRFSQCYAGQPGMCTEAHQTGWAAVVEAVHAQGSKIILQLIHGGAVSQVVTDPRAPSAVRPRGQMLQGYGPKQGAYDMPTELSEHEIAEIKSAFVASARRAESAGFDGIEVHSANGYLLDQFMTPETNQRPAPYGGSVANRMRLTSEIISEIRAAVHSDFIVGVRLSQSKATEPEYFWSGGLKEAAVIFDAVADAGAHYIHMASETKGYAYHSSTKEGTRLTEFARTKTGLPVIANGGLENRGLAREVLSAHEADFISIGKAAMMDPDIPKKTALNQEIHAFSYDLFSFGVTISGQKQWEQAQKSTP